jgi:hypothetical protein
MSTWTIVGFILRIRQNSFDENSSGTVPHLPCSLDSAPSDFWSFGHVKTSLAGHVFNGADKLLEAIIEFRMRFSSLNYSLSFTMGSNK